MKMYLAIAASVLALAACSPSPPETGETSIASACNTVEPNTAAPAMMRANAAPSASLPALQGGPMAGGLYDLASGEQFDGAPSWEDTRHVSVLVTDTHEGTTLDWAEQSGADAATRTHWTARLETDPAVLTFTCGREGTAPISYSSSESELHLRMPDPAGTGVLDLVFVRRAS